MSVIKPKKKRHKIILERICRDSGEDGITTGDLQERYKDVVEDGHDLVFPGEEAVTMRQMRNWLTEMVRDDKLHKLIENRGRHGRTTRFWHASEVDFDDKLLR